MLLYHHLSFFVIVVLMAWSVPTIEAFVPQSQRQRQRQQRQPLHQSTLTTTTTSTTSTTATFPRASRRRVRRCSQLYALEDLTSKLVMDTATTTTTATSSSSTDSLMTTTTTMTTMDPTILLGGAAVLAIAVAIGAVVTKSNNNGDDNTTSNSNEPIEPELPMDVSVPYDAAALLAYRQIVKNDNNDNFDNYNIIIADTAEFATFNAMYKELAVAQVVVKTKQAKLQMIQEKFQKAYPEATNTTTAT